MIRPLLRRVGWVPLSTLQNVSTGFSLSSFAQSSRTFFIAVSHASVPKVSAFTLARASFSAWFVVMVLLVDGGIAPPFGGLIHLPASVSGLGCFPLELAECLCGETCDQNAAGNPEKPRCKFHVRIEAVFVAVNVFEVGVLFGVGHAQRIRPL